MVEAVGIADGDDELAGSQRPRIAERDRDKVSRGDANDSDVRIRVLADHVGVAIASVRKRHLDVRAPVHNMAVGEDQAVGGKNEAGSAGG